MMNVKTNSLTRYKAGFSLVEIMVAMVISIFLLGGVIQVYLANKSSYRFSDASSRIQENARFALESMASDIRMSGFWGCAQYSPQSNNHLKNNLNENSGNYDAAVHDIINNDALTLTANDGLNGSDSITIIGSKPGQNIIQPPFMVDLDSDLEVLDSTSIETNDLVIVSNCSGADIFEVTGVSLSSAVGQSVIAHSTAVQSDTPGNKKCSVTDATQCFSQLYDSSATITVLQNITYSIQAGASGEPALWRSLNGEDEELIEGIEQMQILFGVDSDDDGIANQYITDDAAIAANSNEITAVRIFLVVRSDENNITDSAQVYDVNGTPITASDNRLRQVFSITVALRNRLR